MQDFNKFCYQIVKASDGEVTSKDFTAVEEH